ncbi:MAG: hypothetical protein JW723_01670 [Bacteroidales bacterium]|nr:hypothetical protein [Bacteroidales bacterium]
MKINPGIFWGLILVIIGVSIILRIVFNINLFRVLIAVLLIITGVMLLFGSKGIFRFRSAGNQNIFGDRIVHESPRDNTEYNVIFGKTVYDFRDFQFIEDKTVRARIHTIFGSSYIRINDNIPVKIKIDAAFSGATTPDGNTIVFGTSYYNTPSFRESEKHLYIEAEVVFGHLQLDAR